MLVSSEISEEILSKKMDPFDSISWVKTLYLILSIFVYIKGVTLMVV